MSLSDNQLKEMADDELLDQAIEEAAEVIHAAMKCKRFGYENFHPEKPPTETNIGQLVCETEQLCAVVRILGGRMGEAWVEHYTRRNC